MTYLDMWRSDTFLLYSCKATFRIQETLPRLSDVERSVVLWSVCSCGHPLHSDSTTPTHSWACNSHVSQPATGCHAKWRLFSQHICTQNRIWPTQSQPRCFQSWAQDGHAVCTLWVHHPPPPVPLSLFLLNENLYPKDIAGSDMMKGSCQINSGKG